MSRSPERLARRRHIRAARKLSREFGHMARTEPVGMWRLVADALREAKERATRSVRRSDRRETKRAEGREAWRRAQAARSCTLQELLDGCRAAKET